MLCNDKFNRSLIKCLVFKTLNYVPRRRSSVHWATHTHITQQQQRRAGSCQGRCSVGLDAHTNFDIDVLRKCFEYFKWCPFKYLEIDIIAEVVATSQRCQ